jgi:hypothetical protein
MVNIWAMILNGIVINMVLAKDSDKKYSPYTWINLSGLICTDSSPIGIGCIVNNIPPDSSGDITSQVASLNITFNPLSNN